MYALAIGWRNPELQPPAKVPYTIPNAKTPANVLDKTPQRTKVARAVEPNVDSANAQGSNLFDITIGR